MGSQEKRSVDTATEPPFCIVVGVELGVAGGYALEQATRIARRIPNSQIHAVHVRSTHKQHIENLTRFYVKEKMAAICGAEHRSVVSHVRIGSDVAREIAQIASDVQAELVIVGSRLSVHLNAFTGGTTVDELQRLAPCSVLVAGPPRRCRPAEITPTCHACLRMRYASHGEEWWCVAHGATWWGLTQPS